MLDCSTDLSYPHTLNLSFWCLHDYYYARLLEKRTPSFIRMQKFLLAREVQVSVESQNYNRMVSIFYYVNTYFNSGICHHFMHEVPG